MYNDFLLKSRPQPRPSIAPQPLPSSAEMQRRGDQVFNDRRSASIRGEMANPAEVARRTQAMNAQQLARYSAQLDARDAAISAGRNQTVNPSEVARQTQAIQAQQLARYSAQLDARDAALRPRPKPPGFPPGISPRPQFPVSEITQPVNRLPRPTTPTLQPQPRPTNGVLSRAPRLPASISNAGRGVLGALGGSAGAAASIGPIVYDGSNAGFDAAFPQLAPYRPGLQNAAALAGSNPFGLQGVANHPLNPLNPFGKWWDWAPWNQGKSPNSLNPDPQTSSPNIDPDGSWLVTDPPAFPVWFTAEIIYTVYNYNDAFGQDQTGPTTGPLKFGGRFFGIPIGLQISSSSISSGGITVPRKTYAFTYRNTEGQIVPAYSPTFATAKQRGANLIIATVSGYPFASEGQGRLAPKIEPADLSGLETTPASQIEPDAPPQYQPTGRPEAQPHPAPQPSPQPLPQQIPRPSPAPRPGRTPTPNSSPQPNPTPQPNPAPQPAIDPQAPPLPDLNPGESPFPFFDPNPFTNPFSPFNPANNPSGAPNTTPSRTTTGELRPSPRPEFPGVSPGFGKSYETLQVPDQVTDQYPKPQPQPQPKPAPEADMCKDPCIADMHDTSKGQKPKEITYKAFKKCGDNGPEFETKTLSVPSDQAEALKILLDDAADRQGEKCTTEGNTLTIPEWWAVRPGADRPQFCIMYAEKFSTGKLGKSRWQLTIPHYNRPKGAKPQIPEYKKGNWMGTLTLTDNSKIRINASSASECRRVLNKLKILVPVDKRTVNGKAIKPTIMERADGDLKECTVTPIRGDFYKTGQKQSLPDWVVKFR